MTKICIFLLYYVKYCFKSRFLSILSNNIKVSLDLMENQEKMEIQDSLEQMVIQEKGVHQDPLVPKVLKVSRENVVVLSVLEIKVLKERLEIKDQLDCQVCIILYLCVF